MEHDKQKRKFLVFLTGSFAGAGIVAAATPFVKSMNPTPDKEEQYLDVDISKMQDGQMLSVSFDFKPIYIVKRSAELQSQLEIGHKNLLDPLSMESKQPDNTRNKLRSLRPDIFVAYGICTHLGCSVSYNPKGVYADIIPELKNGGFYCPCHGSYYDLSGRVFKNLPAPHNLYIPKYELVKNNIIRIKRDK